MAARLHGSIRRILLHRGLITPEGELVPSDSQAPSSLEQLYVAAARDFVGSGTLNDQGRPEIRRRWPRGAQHLGPRLVEVDGVNGTPPPGSGYLRPQYTAGTDEPP